VQATALIDIASMYATKVHQPGEQEFDRMGEIIIDRYPLDMLGK
jgi:hypothetical protein